MLKDHMNCTALNLFLIKKDTNGLSFSVYVFSIFVIGGSIWVINKILGTIILIMGLFLAIIRVIMGVHFPKDVIVCSHWLCVCSMFVCLYFYFCSMIPGA